VTTTTKQDALARIAKDVLGIETLETRNSDGLDFHDVAVWTAKAALEAAYDAGGAQRTIYKAELWSPHFHFEALGDTEDNARAALIKGLNKHAEEYRIAKGWWEGRDAEFEFTLTRFGLNEPALRDREEITPARNRSRVVSYKL
jgi:hypothetical protein